MTLTSNRLRKAQRLADLIEQRRVEKEAQTYNESEWREIAAQAGVSEPSAETVVLTLSILDRRRYADPFDFTDSKWNGE